MRLNGLIGSFPMWLCWNGCFIIVLQICSICHRPGWRLPVWAHGVCVIAYFRVLFLIDCWPIWTVGYSIVSVIHLRFYTPFRNNTHIIQNMSGHKVSGIWEAGFLMPTQEFLFPSRFINVILIFSGSWINTHWNRLLPRDKTSILSSAKFSLYYTQANKRCQFRISYATKTSESLA